MSKEAMKLALEALENSTEFRIGNPAFEQAQASLRQAIAEADKQEQGIDWKDMYEKEKRRSAMWSARYERDIGPLERATPQQEQSVSVSNPIGEFPKTILAVIKEVANRNPKNGLDRWTDYETGAYMQDDADAALLWIKNKAKQEQSAEHVGEPVAYLNPDDLCADTAFRWCKIDEFTQPVYTTPQPKREPLTKDQILALWEDTYVQRGSTGIEFARAIESAHGITEE